MSQCGASLVMIDPIDGIEKNWPCQFNDGHRYTHRTASNHEFTDAQDWRTIERKMFETKTGIHDPQGSLLV